MKKIIIILISLTTALSNLYSQYADPYISMIVSPWLVSLNGTTTLDIVAGNSSNSTIVANSLRIEITAGSNVEITGLSSSAASDSRWTIDTQTAGAGNTVVLTNSVGGFSSFDLGNIYLSLTGRIPSEPIEITGTIGYLPGYFPNGAPYSSQGDAAPLDNFTQTSVSVSYALEDCLNAIDDDNDGFIDCSDADCSLSGLNTASSLTVSPLSVSLCEGDSVTLVSNLTNIPSTHPSILYSWWGVIPGQAGFSPISSHDLTVGVGLYYLNVFNVMGCSLTSDTIHVTVTEINPTATQNNSTLTAAMPDAEYQWIDCNTAASPIAGATGQVFNPTQTGSYAVVVSKNGCSETSNCSVVYISSTSSIDVEKESGVIIYPNPFADELYLTFEKEQTDTQINIFGTDGKVIQTSTVSGNTATIETADFPKGLYLIQLISANKSNVFKVAK